MIENDHLHRGVEAVRCIKSMLIARGDPLGAAAFAAGQNWHSTPNIAEKIHAAAVTGTTTADGAGLIGQTDASGLLALSRPREIIGRLIGTRKIPFDTRLIAATEQATAAWTGEGAAAPLTRQNYSVGISLARKKVTSVSVVSEELAQSSAPSAEAALSRDFTAAVISAIDQTFIDAANSGSAAKPASVVYGAPSFVIGGATVANLDAGLIELQTTLVDAGSTLEFGVFVVHPSTLAAMAMLRVSGDGAPAYPLLNVRTGGLLAGLPVVPSASVPRVGSPVSTSIVLLDASRIWIADDGEMVFETARHATLQMLDNPTNNSATSTPTTMVSLLQTHAVGVKLSRYINFYASSGAAAVLTGLSF